MRQAFDPSGEARIRAGLFAKRPRPGEVKTRLEPVLGAAGAAELARALLDDAVGRLCRPGASEIAGELVFAPAEARNWFARTYPGVELRAQVGAGLAERLEVWFADVLQDSAAQVGSTFAAAIGSDSPWTSRARVLEAAALLRSGADVVLGPDLGGGYYLVALAKPVPGLFTEIEMSTRSMFDETCHLIRERGLELALLEPDYDVDEASDWRRLLADLDGARQIEGATPRAVSAFVRTWRSESA